jgi:ATPase subunit of ABC transporter with duplicated ATPase domains
MEELKTKYPELDKQLSKIWDANSEAQQKLQEMKDLYQDLDDDEDDQLYQAFEAIEETIDKVEELDTHRDKIKEVLGIVPTGLND